MKVNLSIVLSLFLITSGTMVSAQVYSVNAVSYVDVNLYAGSNLLANPLNAASNTVGHLFGGVPDGSIFLPWNQSAGTFGPTNRYSNLTGWSDPDAVFVQPNAGFLVVPSPVKISFHGEPWAFARGPTCLTYPANESFWGWFPLNTCGICEPESCPSFSDSTIVSSWNAEFQVYDAFQFFAGFGWVPSEPVFEPAQAFQLLSSQVAFGRSPFLGTPSAVPLVHGRPFDLLRDVQRSGTNVTFRLAESAEVGYSLLHTTNVASGVWQIREQGSNGLVTFSIPATDALGFFKLHPRYAGPNPYLVSRARAGSSFSFDFYSPTSTLYRIERMTTSVWETVTNLAATSNTLVTVIDGAATSPTGQYRVAY